MGLTSFLVLTSTTMMRFSSALLTSSRMSGTNLHRFATKNVLVPVSNGSEEIETVTIVDTLVRAGAMVTVASVSNKLHVTCSRGVNIVADKLIEDCSIEQKWDMIACPGGMPGAEHLRDSTQLTKLLKHQMSEGGYIAGICAAPAVVFAHHGITIGKRCTCFPSPKLIAMLGADYSFEKVVVCNNLVTSQGPGTALAFSIKLVELLFDTEKADEVAKSMIV